MSESHKNINSNLNYPIYQIKSKYLRKVVFQFLSPLTLLRIINHNKQLQRLLNVDITDYKKMQKTEIEIIPYLNENIILEYINKFEYEGYYHIYINDDKEEIKKLAINADKCEKIKIIIDYEVKSFKSLFQSCRKIKKLSFIKFLRKDIQDMSYMFDGCRYLEEINFINFRTNNVKNMISMFNGCRSLKKLDLSSFNTNNVIDMFNMFNECSKLENINVSSFNTEKVIKMDYMFNNCSSLKELNLSNFNTINVTTMSHLFNGCSSLVALDISNFKSNNLQNMTDMFDGCCSLKQISCANDLIKQQHDKKLNN